MKKLKQKEVTHLRSYRWVEFEFRESKVIAFNCLPKMKIVWYRMQEKIKSHLRVFRLNFQEKFGEIARMGSNIADAGI